MPLTGRYVSRPVGVSKLNNYAQDPLNLESILTEEEIAIRWVHSFSFLY